MNSKGGIISGLTEADWKNITHRGLSREDTLKQLQAFRNGIPHARLLEPCVVGKGIRVLSDKEVRDFGSAFRLVIEEGKAAKFVPASGAATRMFQALTSLNHTYDQFDKQLLNSDNTQMEQNLKWFSSFIENINKFAFYGDLKNKLAENGNNLKKLLASGEYKPILRNILDPDGLNYANLPKGFIKFHKYGKESRTVVEEQILEAMQYAQDKNHTCRLHFTFAADQLELTKRLMDEVKKKYDSPFKRALIEVSHQKPSTDTIVVDLENNPFRGNSGNLVFSPGGHGSLLENLNSMESEVIFVKNIDNAAPDHLKPLVTTYKKALGGLLITLQKQVFDFLSQLAPYVKGKSRQLPKKELLGRIADFSEKELNISIPAGQSQDELSGFLWSRLNRPLRICGMIRNEGDPGGCPFWTAGPNNSTSIQIVEKSQVDTDDEGQNNIFQASTHFNPVDIVCSFRDYRGQKFDLSRFVDPNTYFISVKSLRGAPVRILERPGLWNGSMSGWNTVLVEVPGATFLPVKQVMDLVKPEHLGKRAGRFQ